MQFVAKPRGKPIFVFSMLNRISDRKGHVRIIYLLITMFISKKKQSKKSYVVFEQQRAMQEKGNIGIKHNRIRIKLLFSSQIRTRHDTGSRVTQTNISRGQLSHPDLLPCYCAAKTDRNIIFVLLKLIPGCIYLKRYMYFVDIWRNHHSFTQFFPK